MAIRWTVVDRDEIGTETFVDVASRSIHEVIRLPQPIREVGAEDRIRRTDLVRGWCYLMGASSGYDTAVSVTVPIPQLPTGTQGHWMRLLVAPANADASLEWRPPERLGARRRQDDRPFWIHMGRERSRSALPLPPWGLRVNSEDAWVFLVETEQPCGPFIVVLSLEIYETEDIKRFLATIPKMPC